MIIYDNVIETPRPKSLHCELVGTEKNAIVQVTWKVLHKKVIFG